MAFEQVKALLLDTLFHHLHIGIIECGCPNAVWFGETIEQVSCSSTTVPHIIVLLPVLTKFFCKVFLRLLYPLWWGEECALVPSQILRDEQVAALENNIQILVAWRTIVFVPKLAVGSHFVVERRFAEQWCSAAQEVL